MVVVVVMLTVVLSVGVLTKQYRQRGRGVIFSYFCFIYFNQKINKINKKSEKENIKGKNVIIKMFKPNWTKLATK